MAMPSAPGVFTRLVTLCIVLSTARSMVTSNKHVVFMHGILAGPEEWDHFDDLIQQGFPGMPVTKVDAYNHADSLAPMGVQVVNITAMLRPILTNTSSTTVLVCYSQGGLICRGLLASLEHNVETFVSLSSPLAGQFGDTDYLKYLFPGVLRDNVYEVLYSEAGQALSIGGYWNDPHQQKLYREYSQYLAVLNNVTCRDVSASQQFKKNFLRIKNLVLVGGPDDGVITPWQSSQFGYFNASEQVLPMFNQSWYENDAFGLKTLYKRKAVTVRTIADIKHHYWHLNTTVFVQNILPYLY